MSKTIELDIPRTAEERVRLEKVAEAARQIFVPGTWCCQKCKFTLVQSNLNAIDGSVTARDEPGDKCPNCNGPLWRVTWKQEASEMMDRATEQMLMLNSGRKAARDFMAQLIIEQNGAPNGNVTIRQQPLPASVFDALLKFANS